MSVSSPKSARGSVVLVALCFVAVLGISVAGYLALASQSMDLSNRAFQSNVTSQLAEAGVERALTAFNRNDWSGWTLSGTTATRTITFPSDKYGRNAGTPSIDIRIDNYDAFMGGATWNSSTSYGVGEIVGHNGRWYRSVLKSSNKTPSTTSVYWVHEHSPVNFSWRSDIPYAVEDVVHHRSEWYRCTSGHTNQMPPGSRWTLIPNVEVYSGGSIEPEAIISYLNVWYRWTGSTVTAPPVSWYWRNSRNYAAGDVVNHDGLWYCATVAHSNKEPPNGSYWTSAQSPLSSTNSLMAWSSTTAYRLNDVVVQGGNWYRCILANTGQQPPNATYWDTRPLRSHFWAPERNYTANTVVLHNSVWYRCTSAHLSVENAPPPAGNWASADTATWSTTAAYSVNDHVAYGKVWYRCVAAHTNRAPTNASFWSAVNAPVIYARGATTPVRGAVISTQLRATVLPVPLFNNAAAASNELRFQSGTADSYDSNNGTYASQVGSASSFSATLAGGSTTTSAISINSGLVVNGYLAAPASSLAPHNPLTAVAVSATVKGTTAIPTPRVDVSRVSRSPFIPNPAIQDISGGNAISTSMWTWPASGYTIGTSDAKSPTVYYMNGDLSFSAANHILTIAGPVVLDVRGNVGIYNGRIRITNTGSLELHYSGILSLTGNGFVNDSADPKRLVLIGTGNGNSNFQQNQPFHGAIFQPQGTITVNTTQHIYGALSAKNVTFNTTANLHYDTSIRHVPYRGVDATYSAHELRELTVPAEKVSF